MRRGLTLVAIGMAIIPAWIAFLDLVVPEPSGAAIKTAIVVSILPFILAPALFLWGLAHLLKTWASRSRSGWSPFHPSRTLARRPLSRIDIGRR